MTPQRLETSPGAPDRLAGEAEPVAGLNTQAGQPSPGEPTPSQFNRLRELRAMWPGCFVCVDPYDCGHARLQVWPLIGGPRLYEEIVDEQGEPL